jgi:hypothetical protein
MPGARRSAAWSPAWSGSASPRRSWRRWARAPGRGWSWSGAPAACGPSWQDGKLGEVEDNEEPDSEEEDPDVSDDDEPGAVKQHSAKMVAKQWYDFERDSYAFNRYCTALHCTPS